MTIQWKQSQVPSSYRSSNGCLEIGVIGKKYGRSVAVAASRGVCVLDLSIGREENSCTTLNEDRGFPSSCIEGHECSVQRPLSGVGLNHPKWRMFSKVNETLFSVQNMTWWERSHILNGSSEDVLLCTVNYADEGSQQSYLVGWSRRR